MGNRVTCSTTPITIVEQGGANASLNHCSTTPPPKGGEGGGGAASGSSEVVEQNGQKQHLTGSQKRVAR